MDDYEWEHSLAILLAKTFKVKNCDTTPLITMQSYSPKTKIKDVFRETTQKTCSWKKKSRDAFVNQNVNKQNTFLLKQQWEVFY